MDIYNDNMATLQAEFPAVFQALNTKKVRDNKINPIPGEDNFALEEGKYRVFMHSRYNRERELKFLFNSIKDGVDTLVLLGFGNGQAVEKIGKEFPHLKQLIIVDPNPEPLLFFLEQRNLKAIYNRFQNISFIINKTVEETENLLGQMIAGHSRLTVASHLTYRIIYPDYYHALWHKVYDIVRFKAVNIMTGEAYRQKWQINVWRNLQYDAAEIEAFAEMCAGVPAILISGGPSLNKNIQLLQHAKAKALLIAVGSAMTILSSHGIVPHFRLAIDPNEANQQLFAKVDTDECPLIYSNRLFHGILPRYKAPRINIAFGNDDFLETYIFKKAEIPRLAIRSGFSVANSALDMLIKLGCSKIIIVGQDLCYTGGRLHASGAWDEKIENTRQTDKAVDIFGQLVYTSKPFLGMKDLFESLIAGAPKTQFINATEGGLAINGAPNRTLADVLEQDLTTEYDFAASIEQILAQQRATIPDRRRRIDKLVETIRLDLDSLLARNKRILHKLSTVEQRFNGGIPRRKLLTELHLINGLAKKQMQSDFFREVVYPAFLNKFIIRGDKLLDKADTPDRQFVEELTFMRMNVTELHHYLSLTDKLILEYISKT